MTKGKLTRSAMTLLAADARLGSPPHPWYRRLKNIEAERHKEDALRQAPVSVSIPGRWSKSSAQTKFSDPMQALYDDPALSAMFDMPDWLGGFLGVSIPQEGIYSYRS